MRERIIGIGAGGHAKVVLEALSLQDEFQVVGFLDNSSSLVGKMISGVPVLGDDSILEKVRSDGVSHAFIGLGAVDSETMKRRKVLCDKAESAGFEIISLIHPSACISSSALIGSGVTIMARAVINPDTKIGKHVIINTASVIEHDCDIGDYSHVASGSVVSGGVVVGRETLLGAGSCVKQYLRIGDRSVVGAGSVVLKDVSSGVVVAGVPAKQLE